MVIHGIAGKWQNPLWVAYPNGSSEALTPELKANYPTGKISGPAGSPHLVKGTPSNTDGRWLNITVTLGDESAWYFLPTSNPDTYVLTKITNILSQYIQINYGPNLRLASIVDSNNATLMSFRYSGNYLAEVDDLPGGRKVLYTTATRGGATCITSVSQVLPSKATSGALFWGYDYVALQNQPFLCSITVPDPSGTPNATRTQSIVADAGGRVTGLVDGNGNQRIYDYGGVQTQVTVTDPNGVTVEAWSEYFQANGASTGSHDAAGFSDAAQYADSANPYSSTAYTNKNGQQATAVYEGYGNMAQVKDLRAVLTKVEYDYSKFAMGRLFKVTVGSKCPTQFGYDSRSGLLTSVYTPKPGQTGGSPQLSATYDYTALGNVRTITTLAPQSTVAWLTTTYSYTHDDYGPYNQSEALGEPLTVTDPSGAVTHFRYDSRGNVVTVYDPVLNETDYDYNDADQLTVIYLPATSRHRGPPGGPPVGTAKIVYTYAYTGGPLVKIEYLDEDGNSIRKSSSAYGNEGELAKAAIGGTQRVVLQPNAQFRLANLTDGSSKTSPRQYDNVSNLTSIVSSGVQN